MQIDNPDGPYLPPLLREGDPAPYTILNPHGKAKCIIVCDHAGVAVPKKLGLLGLEPEDFGKHYCYDIGARSVSEHLSQLLDAPAILNNYSRAVVDTNRPVDHPTAFVLTGEGKPIPGNQSLTDMDRKCRTDEIYTPFHDQLTRMIDDSLAQGVVPLLIAVHSFTPQFFKQVRPWEFAVLWVQDHRPVNPLLTFFREKGFTVGDNQPYDARAMHGTTPNRHGDDRLIPNTLIEIRHDLIRTEEGCAAWAEMLNDAYRQILADDSIHTLFEGPVFQYDPDASKVYLEELSKKAQSGVD